MGCCNWQSVRIFYQDDLAQAETLGTEAVDWLTERQRLQDERLATSPRAALQLSRSQYLPKLQHDWHGHGFFTVGGDSSCGSLGGDRG